MSARSSNGIQQQQQPNTTPQRLQSTPWFHGKISREEAEMLLVPPYDGMFLVRESTNFPGDYTLCVSFGGRVEHYHIIYRDHHLTIDEEEMFETLGQLVEHYQNDADGLCTSLTIPVPKKGNPEVCFDTKDFQNAGWVIPNDDVKLGDVLGKGEFGDVLLGYWHGTKVAVKTLKDPHAVQMFLTEASVMASLRHPNLVQLMGVVLDGPSSRISLVTEYMGKGDLAHFLRSRGRQQITKKDQLNFSRDCCAGMAHLEAKKVVHRDLASRNVLLSDEMVAKVCDFGLARDLTFVGDASKLPIKWTAPEALKDSRCFSNKSDMWSFGILLWEIYSFGQAPYRRIALCDVVKFVEKGYRMEAPENCPAEIHEIIRQTWDAVPENRPTFAELLARFESLRTAYV
ncbi:Tyrosine-protein kinase CSK [Hypsibius exemplaris]|uniref:Tyrosine-protein kinase n=1 Tax=Hypsibius exemplaris TaxID=2072580 RepID=A0A1W0X8L4_HYPEX|nr:Tyrosine-protein kinase CSK [Hypsibius exemplaris]